MSTVNISWKTLEEKGTIRKLNGGNLVFAGLAEPGFKNWRILMAQFISGAELDKHTQKVVMTPENGLDVLPESEKTAVAEVK
jgi:hypothetical protein